MEESALLLMEEYVQENLDHIHDETFTQEMIQGVNDLLMIDNPYDSCIKAIYVAYCVLQGRTSMISPIQENIKDKLEILQHIYQPDQRSEEWYTMRHQLLTASSIYKILGSDAKRNELICSKCGPINTQKSSNIHSPMHWGIKYEPVSIAYYSFINTTIVQSYGCIAHPTYPFIGASPDGINTLETSELYGRMLEIKNPFTREITGNPKEEYWVQCQVQMEVCNLDVCDFLETKFTEYSLEEFESDGTFQTTSNGNYKGIILHFEINQDYHYEYAPFNCTKEEYNEWEENVMMQYPNHVKTIYWKLDDVHCTMIPRKKEWFAWFLPKIIEFQAIIDAEKNTDVWMNRQPKKKCKIIM